MTKIKIGQMYVEKESPSYREVDKRKFVISNIDFICAHVIFEDGKTDVCGLRYIEEDCQLIKDFDNLKDALQELIK